MNINVSQSTSSIETVTKNLITKLYDLAFNAEEGDIISYQGNIYSAAAYADEVKYLQDNFPNLVLNVPESGQYIKFEDPEIERVLLANNIGDGTGVIKVIAGSANINKIFQDNTTITSFPEFQYFTGMSNITEKAFSNCSNLQNIIIPNNVTEIKNRAFLNCTSLSSVYLPQSCKTLGQGVFMGCSNIRFTTEDLQYIETIGGSRDQFLFTSYNKDSARNAIQSQELYLPNLKNLGFGAFKAQINIRTVNLPNLETLHVGSVFYNCPNLTEVISLGNVTAIDYSDTHFGIRNGMFEGCTSLTTVHLPEALTILSDLMFQNCTNLTNINIPQSIEYLGRRVFQKVDKLTNKILYLPNVIYVNPNGPCFGNKSNMHVYLPNDIQFTHIGNENVYGENVQDKDNGKVSWDYGIVNWFCWINRNTVPLGYNIVNTMYFRDIQAFPAGLFFGCNVKTIIINNTTIPTLIASTETRLLNDSRYQNINNYLFEGYGSIDNIYVPDSAVTDYQNSPLFANVVDKIHPLSECPRITVEQAEQGSVGVIEAYM